MSKELVAEIIADIDKYNHTNIIFAGSRVESLLEDSEKEYILNYIQRRGKNEKSKNYVPAHEAR